MKTQMKVLSLICLLSTGLEAHAFCETNNLEGVFKNKSGDRFRIEQPDCDRLILTDTDNDLTYDFDFKNPANAINMGLVRSLPAEVNRAVPITLSFEPQPIEPSQYSAVFGGMTVYASTRLRIKQLDRNDGLKSPLVRLKLSLIALRSEWGNPASKVNDIYLIPETVQAVLEPGASPVQKTFITGLNMGLSFLMHFITRYAFFGNEDFAEHLTAVKK